MYSQQENMRSVWKNLSFCLSDTGRQQHCEKKWTTKENQTEIGNLNADSVI